MESGKISKNNKKKHAKPAVSDFSPSDALKTEEDGSVAGCVEEIVYRNDLNGYTVLSFGTDEYLVPCVGILPDVSEGDKLHVWGAFETSKKYGRQFRINEYSVMVPTEASDIEKYLASGSIKGIGPKTAARIVETFGEDTSDVIENHCEWLAQIQGITLKRAREISEEYRSKTDVRTVMTFFRSFLGPALTMKAYRRFGSGAIGVAKTSPYRFCDEIDGITFETADSMARKLDVAPDAPERLMSGVRYCVINHALREGHTCIAEDALVRAAASELKVPSDLIRQTVERLTETGVLVRRALPDGRRVIQDRDTAECEKFIAEKIVRLCRGCAPLDTGDLRGLLRKSEAENGISYDDDQKKAIIAALSRGAVIITGGPGTGKTTIITALTGIFESLGFKVALCAPTGRAAKRMTESARREAKTVHRLLEATVIEQESGEEKSSRMEFRRNADNLLDEHVIILDEASMMDTPLTASLLRAVKNGSRLILIGDADQLPPVGAGNVLHDIISSGTIPVITLTHIFRQAEQSLIVTNAHAINRGEMPVLSAQDRDFFFLPRRNDTEISDTVADLCARRLPNAYGPDEIIQVISPSRKGLSGTDQLNRVLQESINPKLLHTREYSHGTYTFRSGDRVMQVRNNYTLEWENGVREGQGIFNGDIGIIRDINVSARIMDIDFDGRRVVYEFTDLDDLEPAYAITVHKAQGSEYQTVVIPLGDVPFTLQTRNLLYTAVTRAKNRVIIVGYESTVANMVGNLAPQTRLTCLSGNLRDAASK